MTPPPATPETPAPDFVRIRPLQLADLPQMFLLQSDPDSNRMAMTHPRTRDAFDTHWAQSLQDPKVAAWVILADEVFVGFISCWQPDGTDHVGYWIDRAHWGRGIATRALQLLLAEVPRRPLTATAAAGNAASLRILRKCGFVLEGVEHSPGSERYLESDVAVFVLRG